MAGEENPVEITINRLQQEILVNRDENAAYNREEEDYKRLQYLSVANTSGDTLVIVKFPDGDFVHCNGRKVLISWFFPFALLLSLARPGKLTITRRSGTRKSS